MRERGARPEEPGVPTSAVPMAPALPIDWMKLDGESRSETLREVLLVWVPKFVMSYELSEKVVPQCWIQHEAMIHELLALFQYRQQQQFNTELGPPPSAPIDYQYQLSLWKTRMRELVGDAGCTSAEHFEPRRQPWVDPENADSARWYVAADAYAAELCDVNSEREG